MAMRKVRGQMLFSRNVDGVAKPIRNLLVQLWDLDVIKNDHMASDYTDESGRFEVSYDSDKDWDRWGGEPDLQLRVLDCEYHYGDDQQPVRDWHVVGSYDPEGDTAVDSYDFGPLRVGLWEYEDPEGLDNVAFTPRVAVIDGKVTQEQRSGRTFEQIKVGLRQIVAYQGDKLVAKFRENHPTNEEIEEDYPPNLTRKVGADSRSDDYICDMVLNGFNPCVLKKRSEGNYFVDFRWDGLTQDDHHFAPNTRANFSLTSGKLELKSIVVQKRVGGNSSAHARYRPPREYTPADGKKWERVKRLFRVNYFVFGEVDTHLGATHLNVEQYIVPFRRNVRANPVAQLLYPHFYGTVAVNLAANTVLMASDGLVQKTSALTPQSVIHAVTTAFSTYNWYDWRPREPLCEAHRFATIGRTYWGLLTRYVDDFFATHDDAIRLHWYEIQAMSDELVAHALPYADQNEDLYYDRGEINTVDKPHPFVNDTKVAISPVTKSATADQAGVDNLKQLCRYLLFIATFKHSWVNDTQYDIGGEIEFASLGVADDLTNLEVPSKTVVPPEEALEQVFITYVLTFTQYGYILRNEDDDMNPKLIEALAKNREAFAREDYGIRGLRSSINI